MAIEDKAKYPVIDEPGADAATEVVGPLNETTAYSFSAGINKADGHSENIRTGNTVNTRDRFSLRGELLFELCDDESIRIISDQDEYDEICCAVGSAAYGLGNQIQSVMGGAIIPNNPYTEKVFYDFDPTTQGDNFGISAHYKKENEGSLYELTICITVMLYQTINDALCK